MILGFFCFQRAMRYICPPNCRERGTVVSVSEEQPRSWLRGNPWQCDFNLKSQISMPGTQAARALRSRAAPCTPATASGLAARAPPSWRPSIFRSKALGDEHRAQQDLAGAQISHVTEPAKRAILAPRSLPLNPWGHTLPSPPGLYTVWDTAGACSAEEGLPAGGVAQGQSLSRSLGAGGGRCDPAFS